MSAVREYLDTLDEQILLLEPGAYDAAIVGLVSRAGGDRVACYDTEKVIAVLMADGMSREEAEDFFEFNIAGAFMGDGSPVFLDLLPLAEPPVEDVSTAEAGVSGGRPGGLGGIRGRSAGAAARAYRAVPAKKWTLPVPAHRYSGAVRSGRLIERCHRRIVTDLTRA